MPDPAHTAREMPARELDTIAHRMRSLLAKTLANGRTEDEAIAAAQKARELIDHYCLSLPAPELDTVPQFAVRANVSIRTIRRKIDEGLPIIKIGCATRIEPQAGMRFLMEGRLAPPPVRRGRPRKASVG